MLEVVKREAAAIELELMKRKTAATEEKIINNRHNIENEIDVLQAEIDELKKKLELPMDELTAESRVDMLRDAEMYEIFAASGTVFLDLICDKIWELSVKISTIIKGDFEGADEGSLEKQEEELRDVQFALHRYVCALVAFEPVVDAFEALT